MKNFISKILSYFNKDTLCEFGALAVLLFSLITGMVYLAPYGDGIIAIYFILFFWAFFKIATIESKKVSELDHENLRLRGYLNDNEEFKKSRYFKTFTD